MSEKLEILVTTTNRQTGEVARRTIDHNNRDDRVWLGKHCFWAFRNNHRVETEAVSQ